MTRQAFAGGKLLLALFAGFAGCLGLSANALAAKPISSVHSEVTITFGGQIYGFSGAQQSFAQTENGGKIVFDVTTVGDPGDVPVPQIDVGALDLADNHWEVVAQIGRATHTFVGSCASETFSSKDAGMSVRHLNLVCATLTSSGTP